MIEREARNFYLIPSLLQALSKVSPPASVVDPDPDSHESALFLVSLILIRFQGGKKTHKKEKVRNFMFHALCFCFRRPKASPVSWKSLLQA